MKKKNPAKKYDEIWIALASIYAEYFTLLKSFVKIAILECEKSYIQLVLGEDNVHLRDFAVIVKARSELLRANHGVQGREAEPHGGGPAVCCSSGGDSCSLLPPAHWRCLFTLKKCSF